jgi:hypothetical protein
MYSFVQMQQAVGSLRAQNSVQNILLWFNNTHFTVYYIRKKLEKSTFANTDKYNTKNYF